jgi:hypothetical protein
MNSTAKSTELHSINPEEPITLPLGNRLSVRLYADSSPHCLETAALQKGLVLLYDREELIEEGLGFGVPIAKYHNKTYFSTCAEVSFSEDNGGIRLQKRYFLSSISKKVWRGSYIGDEFYSSWRKRFTKLYLNHKELTPVFNWLMELREATKIKTEFVKVKSKGDVIVNYLIKPTTIDVNVDFSNLAQNGREELLVLNEQGSTSFDTYLDSDGLKLVGRRIGGWGTVSAKQALLKSSKQQVSFSVCGIRGATLVRGWERTKNRFSWAGLSYSLPPKTKTFGYSIGATSSP